MKPWNVEDLLATARGNTNLVDFGPADFLEPLGILVEALGTDAAIRPDQGGALSERFARLLVNRLWTARDLATHPEILAEDLGAPLVIASLPRTGSTKLHRMLAASGDFQYLSFWKAHMPARMPSLPDGGTAHRVRVTREYERWMYETSPSILTGHPMFTDEAEEDQWLVEGTFRHPLLFGLMPSMRYLGWIMQADMRPTFDYFAALLRYLQWQFADDRGKPWLLKTPNHMGNEAQLQRVLRNPRFVVTHRDPVRCIPSVTSAAAAMRRLYAVHDGATSMAAGNVELFSAVAAQHLRWRDEHPETAVLDLSFREINSDGLSAARKVYAFLDRELSPAAQARMKLWEEQNRRDRHASVEYSAAQFGLTDEGIRTAFNGYRDRFSRYLE